MTAANLTEITRGWVASLLLVLGLAMSAAAQEGIPISGVVVRSDGLDTTLSLKDGQPFHQTVSAVTDLRTIDVGDSSVRLVLWEETTAAGQVTPYYAISLDRQSVATVRATSYDVKLRYEQFDPDLGEPSVAAQLAADAAPGVYIVQFVTQPLEEFREAVRNLGGTVDQFMPNHAHIVRMTAEVRDQVAQLPFVRWVGPVHPAYKLEEIIQQQLLSGAQVDPRRYSIMLYERGPAAQDRVVAEIEALGGEVHGTTPLGFRIEATMTLDQVRQIAGLADVMFIDRKGNLELDMDIVREIGGANYIETVAGYTGQGVRAEVADSELDLNHPEWGAPPIVHVSGADIPHGTSVYGILFAQGVVPQARGLIPDATGIFAFSSGLLGGGPTRYTHTAELVDPVGPYRCVLQTNSTGDTRTFFYTTISAEMDDILFIYDMAITQSQSNAGNQDSRPQAWAKNIISCGAVNHYDTISTADDCWCFTGSIGPADDGRIKPDLCFFYDDTYTTSTGDSYTQFGGTSGATPCVAGHLGLFFQMWSDGIFGNEVDPFGTVFENRCHMTTAKAMLINTATQYPFSGAGHDLTRVHQGWGRPSVQYLYDNRNNISVLDETEVLANLESADYVAVVDPGTPELRLTLVYADPPGSPAASEHRINDLSLKVTSPGGDVYWGNYGLLTGNWSVANGTENSLDTVENVLIQNPQAGVWSVQVLATEVNQDSHVETPEIDADFALVVSGAELALCTSAGESSLDSVKYACEGQPTVRVVDCDLNTDDQVIETVSVVVSSDTEPGGETVLLTETAAETADFRGVVQLSETDGAGVLQVSDRDTLTATYIDADDGQGGINVSVTAAALVDCGAPVISNVQVVAIGDDTATVTFDTDEAAIGTVRYGLACGSLTDSETDVDFETSHAIVLTGLSFDTPYLFVIDAEDDQANAITDDNGGACHSFSTPGLIYDFPMDTDPGWTTEGDWAFGQPTGGGGQYGDPDPTSGFTGSNVYGFNLSGDYANGLAETHLTSTPLDCTGLSNVRLRFQRWLGVEAPNFDHAYVRVSNDGFFWTTVWANDVQYNGGAWTLVDYNISAVADDQPTVYLRWTMGSTDGSWRFCGWNVDDVQIIAVSEEAGPCAAVAARSCRDHGGTVLCLDLFARETEPRLGGTQELEIDLDDASGFGGGVSVSCVNSGDQSGLVSGTSTAGNTVTVSFSPALPDGDTCTVSLDCGASVCVRGVEGDVDGDGTTTTGDASIIKPHFNASAAAAGAQYDFNVDGTVTTADFSQVKPTFNNTAPACP